ncbi:non-ribosomal peptide synthetase [Actinokineospora iranica]|uniref:non-ribosomal peptide synthetase n=1 Tax=Actinokineospora iranica TaxID=1271860 RepID=UPI001587253A|nr:non-ribosomal peptide synthetase [Actinokineospora iranica]
MPDLDQVWLAERFQPGTPANIVAVAASVDGPVDQAALRTALRVVGARRPVLRSRHAVRDGAPARSLVEVADLPLAVIDLRHQSAADQAEALAEVLAEFATRPFDLESAPPIRCGLLVLPDRTLLVLAAHRIAVTEAALGAVLADIRLAYDGRPLPPVEDAPASEGAQSTVDLPAAELPTDRPRSPLPASIGARVPVEFPDGFADAVRAFAPSTDPRTVLLAGWQTLVSRLSGGTEVAVALADTGRVARVDLSDDPGFRAVVARAAAPARADAYRALAFLARDTPLVPETFGGKPMTPVPLARFGIDREMRLVVEPDGDRWRAAVEYAADLFDQASAARIAARYPLLLTAAMAEPDRPVSALPVLVPGEADLAITEWNATETPLPRACLHELIAERARVSPDAVAVVDNGREVTYGDLDARADRLAHVLRGHGAGPERLVGICAYRGAEVVVGVLAVLKAGAAYVPLDPAYPARRLDYLLDDSQVDVVLADERSADLLPERATVVRLDQPHPDADGPPESGVEPENLCYVIYTSGSTGEPKGAANTHVGVVNTMAALVSRLRLDSTSRLLQTSSLNFDMSAFDILATLLAGGALVLPDSATAGDPRRLLDLAHEAGVTAWSSTPALFTGAIDHAYETGAGLPPGLRLVLLGGDRFPPSVPAALAALAPGCRAYNFAGVTEASFTTTAYRVRTEDGHGVPWGRPLPNQRMYVLDAYQRPVPIGSPGELYLGGAGVGRGYWRRPELTARRFLADPFWRAGARMYRTGDRVRQRGDGTVEFLGRLDDQVKVRGFRVELGEVEAVLGAHPLVRAVVAGVRGDRLVAYLVFGDPVPVEDLREFLRARVPDHLVPAAFVALGRIPLTPGGKIDRDALAAIEIPAGRPDLATPYLPPRDELERAIVAEWTRVLGVDGIGADDEFAALGGHSLLATPMMSALSAVLGVPLSARDLFEAATPARLAQRIRRRAPERFGD